MNLVLLGDPVAHSHSPRIHTAALTAARIKGKYQSRVVDSDGVREAFAELRAGSLDGINITMPHKLLAASLCDELDPEAARAGSVNTVTRTANGLKGWSTDIGGIRDAWHNLPTEGPVLILGAGGAARAAAVALTDRPLYIGSRRSGAGSELGSLLQLAPGELAWGVPVVLAVVVNCTPLGMRQESLPESVLDLSSGLFDMAYGSDPTPAVRYARGRGLPAVSGVDLLLAQAARSFTLWTGREAPLAAMRQAVENP
jgi:shikimate dehydrogenase